MNTGQKYLKQENKSTVNLKTERFDKIDSAVIISSVSKAAQNWNHFPHILSSFQDKKHFLV